jgi:hypothetical protein
MSVPSFELMNVQTVRVLHFFLGILRGTLQFLATALDIAAHALHGVATGEDTQHQQGQYCCGLFHVAAPLVITMGLRSVMQAPSPTLPPSYTFPAPKRRGIAKPAVRVWRGIGLLADRLALSQQMPCQNNIYH